MLCLFDWPGAADSACCVQQRSPHGELSTGVKMSRFSEKKMSQEQPSSGPLQAQMDPDGSRMPNPETDPGWLRQFLMGDRTVEPDTGGVLRRSIPDIDRRFARPVDDQKAGGTGSSGSRNERRRHPLH
jgi:hypothetical protein